MPGGDLFLDGPVGCREFVLARTCEISVGHSHNFDHVTVVNRGALRVYTRLPGEEVWQPLRDYQRGDFFTTRAGLEHKLKALENGTRYTCIFCHRDFGSHDTVAEYNGNLEAYA